MGYTRIVCLVRALLEWTTDGADTWRVEGTYSLVRITGGPEWPDCDIQEEAVT